MNSLPDSLPAISDVASQAASGLSAQHSELLDAEFWYNLKDHLSTTAVIDVLHEVQTALRGKFHQTCLGNSCWLKLQQANRNSTVS